VWLEKQEKKIPINSFSEEAAKKENQPHPWKKEPRYWTIRRPKIMDQKTLCYH